ncbi:hypothetical protein M0Q97_05825 [Candidatus Dojkabacteria bacterium]|jgi:hypothetical protein|nr:hypothetical protein [Candidatus Dojkabacteria bacterium]
MKIPETLEECYIELNQSEGLDQWLAETEKDAVVVYHSSTGRWIRNNWGLWTDSKLKQWFISNGITEPDDMSGVILRSFYRYKKGLDINLEDQFKQIKILGIVINVKE